MQPDYVFETSWEVCNKVGGIYTVLSTRAKSLTALLKDRLIFIGPDVHKGEEKYNSDFIEGKTPYEDWAKEENKKGEIMVRCGHWDVPGKPVAILIDFKNFWKNKNDAYYKMWQWYGIESDKGYGDYDESCVFALSVAYVMEGIYSYYHLEEKRVVAHFNEWTVGMGLLHVHHTFPEIKTIFTTHATSIGRSIAFNEKELYKYFKNYNGDQMAQELNMVAKHFLEKKAAQEADCFTTVSDITALECEQLLGVKPHIVTPNGFEGDYLPTKSSFGKKCEEARKKIKDVLQSLLAEEIDKDALLVGIGGRYEYRNKGINMFIDALNHLRTNLEPKKEVIGLIFVPAWSDKAREDLLSVMEERKGKKKLQKVTLQEPYTTHTLYNDGEDKVLNHLRRCGFVNAKKDRVKILFVPVYLTGVDGIFNKSYYDLLIGLDIAVFPSYYEPWGYTPLESVSFSIPTITTDKAGFGIFCQPFLAEESLKEGMCVIHRDDDNYWEAVEKIAREIEKYTTFENEEVLSSREKAKELSTKALWKNFISYYKEAYSIALSGE
ncbi:MAG TPA: glycosyl transferase [Porphyromonadaceae bacterium]|nr:glycosyl transferase [Porphyromonadaceae bacterium]